MPFSRAHLANRCGIYLHEKREREEINLLDAMNIKNEKMFLN